MYEVYPHPTTRSKGGAQARAGVVKRRHTTASCFSLFVAAVAAALLFFGFLPAAAGFVRIAVFHVSLLRPFLLFHFRRPNPCRTFYLTVSNTRPRTTRRLGGVYCESYTATTCCVRAVDRASVQSRPFYRDSGSA